MGIYSNRVMEVRIKRFLNLVQDYYLSPRVLEPTRVDNVLDIVLTS